MNNTLTLDTDKKKWVDRLARAGYAAKGVVFILTGALALAAALGAGGSTGGKDAAANKILEQPFGQILLALIAVGLLGYVVWRLYQAFSDPENHGDDTKAIVKRVGYGISGLIYLGFAVYCFGKVLGNNSGGGGQKESVLAKLMSEPWGIWLVGIAGLITIGVGIVQIYRGFKDKFKDEVDDQDADQRVKRVYDVAGKVGFIARGAVLMLIGFFVTKSAMESQPEQVKSTGEVFNFLSASGGPWILAAVALGFIGYGVFMFVMARYKRFNVK